MGEPKDRRLGWGQVAVEGRANSGRAVGPGGVNAHQRCEATVADCRGIDRAEHPGKLFTLPDDELEAIMSEFEV